MFANYRSPLSLGLGALFTLNILGCASVNSVSLTPIPAHRSNQVKAEVSKMIFLGFSFDNDFIDPLVDNLKQQCPNGVISGILTKDEVISYFILFNRRVVATGFCNNTVAKAVMNKKNPRNPSAVEEEVELQ